MFLQVLIPLFILFLFSFPGLDFESGKKKFLISLVRSFFHVALGVWLPVLHILLSLFVGPRWKGEEFVVLVRVAADGSSHPERSVLNTWGSGGDRDRILLQNKKEYDDDVSKY